MIPILWNEKIFETDYPRDRAIEVYLAYARYSFCRTDIGIILAKRAKNRPAFLRDATPGRAFGELFGSKPS